MASVGGTEKLLMGHNQYPENAQEERGCPHAAEWREMQSSVTVQSRPVLVASKVPRPTVSAVCLEVGGAGGT